MAYLLMRRKGDALVPASKESADALSRLPEGKTVMVKAEKKRSLPQLQLYWAVLQHVAEASEWETKERLHVALKIRLGLYDLLKLPSGKVVPVPQSIALDEKPQDEFQAYFDNAMRLICEEVIPGTDKDALIAEVQGMIGQAA